METRIKHVAICTENYDRMAEFYKSIFGMKKITNGMTDATGKRDDELSLSAAKNLSCRRFRSESGPGFDEFLGRRKTTLDEKSSKANSRARTKAVKSPAVKPALSPAPPSPSPWQFDIRVDCDIRLLNYRISSALKGAGESLFFPTR